MNSKSILEEIIALGGTKEDLELLNLNDDDSMSEYSVEENDPSSDDKSKGLINEIKLLLQQNDKLTSTEKILEDKKTTKEINKIATKNNPKEAKENLLEKTIKKNSILPLENTKKKNIKTGDANQINQILSSLKSASKQNKLIFNASENWFDANLVKPIHPESSVADDEQISTIYKETKLLYDKQVEIYQKVKSTSRNANSDFVKTVLKSGTITDKVSALTLIIQESPLYSLNLFQNSLIQMANKNSRREAILAIDSVKDLFINTLLPDRKLRYFRDLPVASKDITPNHLLLYYFEDTLKKLYFDFILIVEELAKDTLLHVKNKMVMYIYDLLVAKPEQEQNLLSLLVNKLGDQEKKIASKIVHLLSLLLEQHPKMKLIIAKETEQLIFRQNINQRTQYYGVTFLNQIILSSRNEEEVACANKLIDIYFRLFEVLVVKAKGGELEISQPKNVKDKKIKGKKNNKKSVQIKKTETSGTPIVVDGIDAKVMSALLTGINRAFPYSKLDQKVHINMLFTLTHIGTFNTCIQSLTLLHQILQNHPRITDRYYKTLYQTLFDKRLLTASKQSLYLNLLYKSLKQDESLTRMESFIKRILQICFYLSTPFVCACLYLIGELGKTRQGIWSMITVGEDGIEENFIDMVEETEEGENEELKEDTNLPKSVSKKYDGLKRDPLYSNAELSCLWELIPYAYHFHPTVKLYAQILLSAKPIPPPKSKSYDPLQNHTLGRFLDRFVYKNPKNLIQDSAKGRSLMQPTGSKNFEMIVSGGSQKKKHLLIGNKDDVPVNTLGNWKDESEVPVDEEEEFDINEEELEEDEVWDAIKKSTGFPAELEDGEDDNFDDEDANLDDEVDDSNDDVLDKDFTKVISDEEVSDGEMEAWMNEDDDEDVLIDSENEEMSDSENLENKFVSEEPNDELGSDSEENGADSNNDKKKSNKPKAVVKSKKSLLKMKEKAVALGFKGNYFDKILKKKANKDSYDDDDIGEGIFAAADEFESIIVNDDGDDGNSDVKEYIKGKPKFNRKRKFLSNEVSDIQNSKGKKKKKTLN
ncbi:hypothetical protein HK099_007613 [Clydaea vesicula]|uniref:CCAAT-binding factor domain-containing protein n=1 Tax=Clydaea vesicula TaxID=447962 RepID=A0AAD5U123_9FUNG|nr:hypothetical protein HK099_007613 [Clydaea vesicula]